MLEPEAEWIERALRDFPVAALDPILDVGSSTARYREIEQPWLQARLYGPLAARGVTVVHCDRKQAEGIDVVADIFDDDGFARMQARPPGCVFCCNMFEHVTDRAELARRLLALTPPGGLLLVTVPQSYPYHRDPIDTMFRPMPDDIAALFGDTVDVLRAEVIETGSYRDNVRARPWIVFRHLRFFFPFLGWTRWKRSMRKLGWLVSPYRHSCVIMRKR